MHTQWWHPTPHVMSFFGLVGRVYHKEHSNKKSKDSCKANDNNVCCFFITIIQLAIPTFFRFTDVTAVNLTTCRVQGSTPKGPPPYCGGVVCVSQRPIALCRLKSFCRTGLRIETSLSVALWSGPLGWGLGQGLRPDNPLPQKNFIKETAEAWKIHYIMGTLWPVLTTGSENRCS